MRLNGEVAMRELQEIVGLSESGVKKVIKQLREDIAKNYYITGDRLSPKGVRLDRALVEYRF